MNEGSSKLDRILMQCIRAIEEKGWSIDDCLRRYPRFRQDLEPTLEAAIRLRQARSIRPSLRFKREAVSRMQLRLQASQRPPSSSLFQRRSLSQAIPPAIQSPAQKQPALQWALPILVMAFAFLAMTQGFIFVANAAKPGDVLYPVDLAIEQAQVRLALNPQRKATLHLAFASERLGEAAKLLEDENATHLVVALRGYKENIQAAETLLVQDIAGKEEHQSLIAAFTLTLDRQAEQLQQLMAAAPPEAQDTIRVALAKASSIQAVMATATPSPKATPMPQADDTPGSPSAISTSDASATTSADGTPTVSTTPGPPTEASSDTPSPTSSSPPLPDLTIASIQWPSTAGEGILLNLSYRVSNDGTGPAADGFISQLFVDDEPLGNIDKQIGFHIGVGLDPGKSDTYGFVWRTTCGMHILHAIADHTDLILESNENNNVTAYHEIVVDCGTPPLEE